eukprot:6201977-Pleurochrysis_carterae.AAC.1
MRCSVILEDIRTQLARGNDRFVRSCCRSQMPRRQSFILYRCRTLPVLPLPADSAPATAAADSCDVDLSGWRDLHLHPSV